jgi:hypothetical protein
MSRQKLAAPRIDARPYRGQWVAIDPTTRQIIGHGDSLEVAEEQAAGCGVTDPWLWAVPATDGYFIGGAA